MTTSDAPLPEQPRTPFEERKIQAEASARKRAQVRLSERRPTAKDTIHRPPDARPARGDVPRWMLFSMVSFLIFLVIVNVLLISTMVYGSPLSWPQLRGPAAAQEHNGSGELSAGDTEAAAGAVADQPGATATVLQPIFEDDFTRPTAPLAQDYQPEQWDMGFVRRESVYRMRVWPGWAALSILDPSPQRYRVEAEATMAVETPQGYTGILGRYLSERSMYMFIIDGQGRFQVQLQQEGQWQMLQPWTDDITIQLAGEPNTLALEDRGDLLRFLVNDVVMFEVRPLLPQGSTGLITGAPSDSRVGIAESNFNHVALYELTE